jgi:organic hydroperoxide reductase OsmC/OhrA
VTPPSKSEPMRLHLSIEQIDGYEFRVRFDNEKLKDLVLDEPPPLGRDAGPNPARVLGAAIADCLCASLLFCMKKAGVAVGPIDADVVVELERNERKRLRIPRVDVTIRPTVAESDALSQCFSDFEDFCVVTESVRKGIEVSVKVEPLVDGREGPTA